MTLYQGIHTLKPGHMLIVSLKDANRADALDIEERRYWDAEFPLEGEHDRASDAEFIERVREAMKHVLPEVLYKREKFAFMAPPARTDAKKAAEIDELIDKWLSSEKIRTHGIFDEARLRDSIADYGQSDDHAANTRKDIILNHAIALHAIEELV